MQIQAPLSRVWRVFADLAAWNDWNSVCRECCLLEGTEMAPGTCFAFKLRPYYLPIEIQPRITKCEAGREVVWEGRRLGIHAVHRFEFRETDGGVTLISTEEFGGPLLFLCRLVLLPQKLHRLSVQLLQDIKKAAEACQPPGS